MGQKYTLNAMQIPLHKNASAKCINVLYMFKLMLYFQYVWSQQHNSINLGLICIVLKPHPPSKKRPFHGFYELLKRNSPKHNKQQDATLWSDVATVMYLKKTNKKYLFDLIPVCFLFPFSVDTTEKCIIERGLWPDHCGRRNQRKCEEKPLQGYSTLYVVLSEKVYFNSIKGY